TGLRPFRGVSATRNTIDIVQPINSAPCLATSLGMVASQWNISNNPFVFSIQALGLLLSFDHSFEDGIRTPQPTMSSLAALPCAECFNAPVDELGSGAI
ncbi:hypothetical protein MRX96_053315, partial [Rhipicephalus microplus]